MRRLLLIPVLLLGLAAGGAFASGQRADESSTVGKISALGPHSISVDGRPDLTCRLSYRSPNVTGFAVGDRVGIGCSDGVLRRIVRVTAAASTTGTVRRLGIHRIGIDGDRDLTCRLTGDSPGLGEIEPGDRVAIACVDGVLVKIAGHDAQPEVKTDGGAIAALDSASITVRGERTVTCRLAADSPISREFHVGDQVGIGCVDGVVVKIVRLPQAAEPPAPTTSATSTTTTGTTTAASATTTYATGAISALGPAAISVHGDRDTTCSLATSSPKLGDYRLGDRVKLSCLNGVLYALSRTDGPIATTTTATTTATATTTTTPPVTLSATGAISALSETAVSVRGDRDTSCILGSNSPKLGDYRLGDRVRISCTNGVLTAIVRTS